MLYGYDALNRISNIHYGNGVETAYTYDGNGNHTAKTGTQATLGDIISGSNALDLSYVYDVRGQLLEERRNGASVCYAYDKAGNRIRKTDVQGEIRYLYNEKNQLTAEESPADRKQFSYDHQGGIIEEKNSAGIRLFSYNSRHQQTRVETENGNVQENRYDAEGLRFELLENGRRTSFVYHDGELLQEEGREEQGTSYHLGAGMEAFRRGQELSYYHRDEQLSTTFITGRHGDVLNSYQYDAFGVPLETTEQLNNRIRYTGQQYDDVTGQYYLRARYYNPVAGRFMQEDVYQGDGLNLYAYCGNNPVVYYDPSGWSNQQNGLNSLSDMTYEEIVDSLYIRSDQLFQQKIDTGKLHYSNSELLPDELDAVLGMNAVSGDNLSPHHMPSAHSILENEGMNPSYGACSNVMTDTHKNTFTYGMNNRTRRYDMALYESLSYEDRLVFDQYDLQRVYAESRPNVDMDIVKSKLKEEYDMAMGMREVKESLTLEGEQDMRNIEEMKEEGCR